MDDVREKLRAEVLACRWADLEPHHTRGGLLLVRPDLDLLEAGVALATDRTDRVEIWLTVGRLGRPNGPAVADLTARDPRFQVVIVQPWVLAQEIVT
ncbi:MAG: DUF2288 family protein [Myxococcales bacterium]|nr:DUF2288 family protein [Myxococcales bacterium]MCB9669088.1 DUF2288 family protein [Alphaproteobacteria bacterium]